MDKNKRGFLMLKMLSEQQQTNVAHPVPVQEEIEEMQDEMHSDGIQEAMKNLIGECSLAQDILYNVDTLNNNLDDDRCSDRPLGESSVLEIKEAEKERPMHQNFTNIESPVEGEDNRESDPDFSISEEDESSSEEPENLVNEANENNAEHETNNEDNAPEKTNNEQNKTARTRYKRRLSDPSVWKYNVNKRKRELGKAYYGRKGDEYSVERFERKLKIRCKCSNENKQINCRVLSEEERLAIFESFWKLSWDEKLVYVTSRILQLKTQRARNRNNEDSSRRTYTYQYYLNRKNERIRVCKTMFCNTLGISQKTVGKWIEKSFASPIATERERNGTEQEVKRSTRFEMEKQGLKDFFDNLPKLESHYCRKNTSKLYLEPMYRSKAEVYKLYKNDWCVQRNIKPLTLATFYNMFSDLNLAIFSPKKDECDTCVSYKTKNVDAIIYTEHQDKKEQARKEKEKDKESSNKVFTMDLQSVLLSPKSNVSALYYRTKLIVHNFTIYDLHTKEGHCFIWHEGEGDLTANCFSSIICQFLLSKVIPSLEPDQKIILFSDGCPAQNRNTILSNALLNLSALHKVCIMQKYLEKGHTQMECDSMHSTIERRLKGRTINVPADYVDICRQARDIPKPYEVNYLNHEYFKNVSVLNLLKTIRPGSKTSDPKVNDLRALKYNENGTVDYKIKYSDDFQLLPVRLNHNPIYIPFSDLPNLYNSQLKIKKEKFDHLMFLKRSIEPDYHYFYDNLKHE